MFACFLQYQYCDKHFGSCSDMALVLSTWLGQKFVLQDTTPGMVRTWSACKTKTTAELWIVWNSVTVLWCFEMCTP